MTIDKDIKRLNKYFYVDKNEEKTNKIRKFSIHVEFYCLHCRTGWEKSYPMQAQNE